MNQISAEIKGHFLRLYAMAFSDSNFHHAEMDMLYSFAEAKGISKSELHAVITSPVTETTIPESYEDRVDHLYDFACMAWADGEIVEDERNTLRKYCKLFEIESNELEGFVTDLINSTDPKAKMEKVDFIKKCLEK